MAGTRSFDLLDGDWYVSDPYPDYAWLRDNSPAYWDETNELWGISRYDDIVEIEKRKDLFISSDQEKGGYRPNIPADPAIIGLDDPLHTERRMIVARRFTPRAVTAWDEHITAVVDQLVEDSLRKGRIDLIADLAGPLPARMIGWLLGFPEDAWPKLMDWSSRSIVLGGGPRYMDEDGVAAVMEFAAACSEVYDDHKSSPADSVMDAWVAAEQRGLELQDFDLDRIISDCLLLLDGGAETTRTVIGRTILTLIDRPDQWERLKGGADLDVAVEEFIRYVTPVVNMCRVATADHEIGGETIRKGQQVVLMYPSANRDPAHFEDPEDFDVTRDPNNHLAFGFGTHFCLGASLARLEIKRMFEALIERVDEFRLAADGEVVEIPNSFVYGLARADVELVRAG
jgi:cytochrome P450 family 142 subfamily A polypeptide 1